MLQPGIFRPMKKAATVWGTFCMVRIQVKMVVKLTTAMMEAEETKVFFRAVHTSFHFRSR